MFVKTESGFIPEHTIDVIQQIETHIYGRKTKRWAAIVDREAHWIHDDDLPEGTVIPATPGYDLLICFAVDEDEEQFGMLEYPIVAWKVEGTVAWPVTVELLGDQWHGIRSPNGKIKCPYEGSFETMEDFIAEFRPRFIKPKTPLQSIEQSP